MLKEGTNFEEAYFLQDWSWTLWESIWLVMSPLTKFAESLLIEEATEILGSFSQGCWQNSNGRHPQGCCWNSLGSCLVGCFWNLVVGKHPCLFPYAEKEKWGKHPGTRKRIPFPPAVSLQHPLLIELEIIAAKGKMFTISSMTK